MGYVTVGCSRIWCLADPVALPCTDGEALCTLTLLLVWLNTSTTDLNRLSPRQGTSSFSNALCIKTDASPGAGGLPRSVGVHVPLPFCFYVDVHAVSPLCHVVM